MLRDNFLEELTVKNHQSFTKYFQLFSVMLFNELKDGLTANKMRSWPAELISIILLYCFFPWKTHLSFLSTCCFLFTIENGEVCAKVSAKEETLKKVITALISTWQLLFDIESISE